jgi:DNA-binding MarR family transcriptional regulator
LTVNWLEGMLAGMSTPSIADTYFSIPELMRVARGSYKRAVDAVYAARGIDDFPAPGGYIVSYLLNGDQPLEEMIEGLGIRKREYEALLDKLTLRGYITREIDPADGSVSLALTGRGREAGDAIVEGARVVDDELERRLTAEELAGLRRGLAVLGEIKLSMPKV